MIPPTHADLIKQPLIGHLATVRPDGCPQSSPVWFEWDGEFVRISQTRSAQKLRNLEAHPVASLSVLDPEDPYRHVEVRLALESVEDDPECAFVDSLAQRYLARAHAPFHLGDQRVVVTLRPTGFSSMG
ncbi:MAG: PPOX class F420-dependent oxidoreductase [Actinomycetota bacterium]|nr:PPOX class F420-dependent oxidoreductase [Actinomycetota bacterium]